MLHLPEPVVAAPSARPRRWHRRLTPFAVAALPTVVLALLGTAQILQDRALWYDEAYSKLAAGVPLGTLASGVWHRTGVVSYLMDVPPSFNAPYYVLLHGWVTVFGDGAASLRAASLAGALGAVAVLTELARRLAGPGTALVAGLLLVSSPLLVGETTQARSYGAALLAVALCALWLHGAITRGGPLGRSVLAAAVAALLHWFTIPVLVGFAVYALRCRPGSQGRRAAVLLLAACLPAGALVGWSLAGGTYGAPHPQPVGLRLPVEAVVDWSGGSVVLASALAVAAAAGIWRGGHRLLLVCWVVLPLVLVTAMELVRATYYPRYLLFPLVGLAVAAAVGIKSLPLRRPVVSVLLAAGLVAGGLVSAVADLATGDREPTPAVVAYLADHQVAGEPVVPADGRVSLDLQTYLDLAPRLAADIVLPPEQFTDQTSSSTVWLVRVVLKEGSLPVVPAEQRLADAGWTQQGSTQLVGATTDLRVERWTR